MKGYKKTSKNKYQKSKWTGHRNKYAKYSKHKHNGWGEMVGEAKGGVRSGEKVDEDVVR